MTDEMTAPAGGETLLVADRLGQERAGVRAPGAVGVRAQLGREARQERGAPLRRVEVTRECEDRRITEARVAVRIAAGCVHEQCAADRRVLLGLCQRDAE
jgi:hypothetical protein